LPFSGFRHLSLRKVLWDSGFPFPEPRLKLRTTLTFLMATMAVQGVWAQETGALPKGYALNQGSMAPADKVLVSEADNTRSKVASSLKGYLVAFDSRTESRRLKVGLPLASFADDTVQIAYDLGGKNVMAQSKFAQSQAMGHKLNYQAYVGEAGTVNFVISSRF
jgi:hypothetical protein